MGTLLGYLIEALIFFPLVFLVRKKTELKLSFVIAGLNLLYYYMIAGEHLLYLALYIGVTYIVYQIMVNQARYKMRVFAAYVAVTLSIFVLIKLNLFKIMGYSFILLQNYAFLYSRAKNDSDENLGFVEFFAISTFFPIITAGPISSLSDIGKQLSSQSLNLSNEEVRWGGLRILNAFFKKALIDFVMVTHFSGFLGNSAGKMNLQVSFLNMALVLMYYYFDFSASSDLAIGGARIAGFRIAENFKAPYTSYSVAEFWRRWHISLGSWFQNYFLIPIQLRFLRNEFFRRFSKVFNYVMVFVTFIAIGLWHGIGTRYLLWGALNGFFVVLTHRFDRIIKGSKVASFFSWIVMILVAFMGQYLLLTAVDLVLTYRLGTSAENILALGYFSLLFLVHYYDTCLSDQKIVRWPKLIWILSLMQIVVVLLFFNPQTTFMYSDF
ncbi:MAG: MBOAT family O-acyltransferase [Bacillota bacterium]